MSKFRNTLLEILKRQKKTAITPKELLKKAGVSKSNKAALLAELDALRAENLLLEEKGKLLLAANLGLVPAEIVKVNETFGFARIQGDEVSDVFIPGRYLMGTLPGDLVLIRVIQGSGQLPEGQVESVLQETDKLFSGTLVRTSTVLHIVPDSYVKFPIAVSRKGIGEAKNNDKVLARIFSRGKRHSQHVAEVLQVFGDSDRAKNCCDSILAANGVAKEFPAEVLAEAKKVTENGIHPKELAVREDLRDECIFTIDSAESKDLDDAVSLHATAEGWELGVHIADVSYYVGHGSALDKEAFQRGTSVYYANSVIPMLPPELSNGICSLNPQEDRLTVSAFITLGSDGLIKKYGFAKTVIRSKVKGIYSEINSLLDDTASGEIREKYKEMMPSILEMHKLAELLTKNRMQRGGLDLESSESKIILDENGVAVDIVPRHRGVSECIIEEFMLTTNEAAASFAQEKHLPFIYRVHENPSPDRLFTLFEVLAQLNVNAGKAKSHVSTAELAHILSLVKDTSIQRVVNNMVLRSMAKAKYSDVHQGHFGLVLDNYSQFTSPIRRYPDLVIHRILSGFLTGMRFDNIEKRFTEFVKSASAHSTQREITAMTVERMCEDCYKAEYIQPFLGQEFEGVISSVAPHGIYVELPNSVEGMISARELPGGDWENQSNIAFVSRLTGKRLQVGDAVTIQVAGATVSSGQIDFKLIAPALA